MSTFISIIAILWGAFLTYGGYMEGVSNYSGWVMIGLEGWTPLFLVRSFVFVMQKTVIAANIEKMKLVGFYSFFLAIPALGDLIGCFAILGLYNKLLQKTKNKYTDLLILTVMICLFWGAYGLRFLMEDSASALPFLLIIPARFIIAAVGLYWHKRKFEWGFYNVG